MYFLFFILIVLALFVLLMFYVPAAIKAKINTDNNVYDVFVHWLSPVFKAKLEVEDYKPVLSIKLFDKQVYKKAIKPRKGQGRRKNLSVSDYYHALVLSNSYVDAHYGLNNPFALGIASGIVGLIGSYFDIDINQSPELFPFSNYLIVNAGTQLNIGKSLFNLLRAYAANKYAAIKKSMRSDEYGTVEYG